MYIKKNKKNIQNYSQNLNTKMNKIIQTKKSFMKNNQKFIH